MPQGLLSLWQLVWEDAVQLRARISGSTRCAAGSADARLRVCDLPLAPGGRGPRDASRLGLRAGDAGAWASILWFRIFHGAAGYAPQAHSGPHTPLGPSLCAYSAGVSRDSGFCVATPDSRDTRAACKCSYLGPLPGGSYQGPPRSGGLPALNVQLGSRKPCGMTKPFDRWGSNSCK